MILQELVRYYERKTKDPDSALPPEGWIPRNIDFLIWRIQRVSATGSWSKNWGEMR